MNTLLHLGLEAMWADSSYDLHIIFISSKQAMYLSVSMDHLFVC